MRLHTTQSGHEIRYEPTPAVEAFLDRVRAALESATVTSADLIALIYSRENPILDTSRPGPARVTREVLANPVYDVLQDLLFRKEVAETGADVDAIAARYSVTVPDAAERMGVAESSVRRAIRSKRLASWVRGGKHFVDPDELARLEDVGRRGPVQADVSPLEYRIGNEGSSMLRIQIPGEPEPNGRRAPVEGVVQRWRRVGVLHGNAGRLTMFVIAPAPKENEIRLGDLYVRGRFRVESAVRERAASAAWDSFRAV